ncbi:MAG: ABC transporter ATP-binding protein [Acidimicrobiia bacterium]
MSPNSSNRFEISPTAILVEGVHINYRVYADSHRTLRDVLARKSAREYQTVQAVQGVSFQVQAGEAVGIIGANGSGKSTLLRAVAGLIPVDQGRVLVRSEPTMLDVGAALNRNMSGARNIYVGCLALGLTRKQVDERFDSIVAFAGLEDSIQRPMRTYSSGMRARLRFAIASAVSPEILLIDEALAVGDRNFKKKSLARVRELVDQAGTVIMVTHNLGEVKSACNRAIWMNTGRIMVDGPPDEVIAAYERGDLADPT